LEIRNRKFKELKTENCKLKTKEAPSLSIDHVT
jgi:hypothetical protein